MTEPRTLKRRKGKTSWFFVSVILHVVAAVALVFFTPLREILIADKPVKKPVDSQMSSEKLAEVAETLDKITEDRIEQNLRAMHDLLSQMELVNDMDLPEFAAFEHQQIEQTPEMVDDHLISTLEAMKEAKEQLEQKDNTKAVISQALARSHQESILQRLELVEAADEIREAQEEAAESQKEATDQTEKAYQEATEATTFENRIEYSQKEIPVLEERLAQSQESVKAAEAKQKETEDKAKEVKELLDQAVAENKKESEIKNAEKRVESAEKHVKSAEKSVAEKKEAVAKYEERLAESKAKLEEASEAKKQLADSSEAAQKAAEKAQTEALEQQGKVLVKVQQEIARKVAELNEKLAADETLQQELLEKSEMPATAEMDAAELYETAQELEGKLAEKFRQGRAMRLAMLQNVPYQAAKEAIDAVNSVHPEIDAAALSDGATTEGGLERKKEASRTALEETNAMVMLGNSLLSQALAGRGEGTGQGGGTISLAAIQARSADMKKLGELADQETSGQAVDLSQEMQGGEGDQAGGASVGSVPEITKDTIPVAGRKVSDVGEPAQWMGIDEWYILGPFDNAGRANIDRVFPPETLIDLNATYLGKGERQIRWDFIKTTNKRGAVVPPNDEPYGIWYAYTELKMDRARDLWLSMGSDDKGQIWINGTPVWVSASYHKSWRPDEAFRRVHFKEGRNKILYRVENGQNGMAFSLWLSLMEN